MCMLGLKFLELFCSFHERFWGFRALIIMGYGTSRHLFRYGVFNRTPNRTLLVQTLYLVCAMLYAAFFDRFQLSAAKSQVTTELAA